MGFDRLTKRVEQLKQRRKANLAAEDTAQEELTSFEALLPELSSTVLHPALLQAQAIINQADLDARLAQDAAITNWLGQKVLLASGVTHSLFELSFTLPHPEDPSVPHFDGRVALLVLAPPGKPIIEVHGTEMELNPRQRQYVKLCAMGLSDITTQRVERELDKAITLYIGG